MPQTKFYGSQVGGSPVVSHSYTGDPLSLLWHDIGSAFSLIIYLPTICFPMNPLRSGHFCELYPSILNLWSMFLHVILVALQLPFLLSIPFWLFFPVWLVVVGMSGFLLVNKAIWLLLNGTQMEYSSDPTYASNEGHEHEQWIFLNGVAVGKHWLQSNINRLALSFHRPILGVHNKSNGIIFDVLQCLIQRNFNYATNDVRSCYAIVKAKLYDPTLTKVIFILHSQGGIEGGMIIDWLLQEVPQDLLAKLEVYTFGNAANHFNNPHLHLSSLLSATSISSTKSKTVPFTSLTTVTTKTTNTTNVSPSKITTSKQPPKTIRYIEHYAHTSDFVAQWGVLHFTKQYSVSATAPRFMGRVFERQGNGHQLCMHYLDSMFPLKRSKGDKGRGGSGFIGVDEDISGEESFMGSAMVLGNFSTIDGKGGMEREGLETSYLGAKGEDDEEVILRDMSPLSPATMREFAAEKGLGMTNGNGNGNGTPEREFKVKDLSRLWLYVNGKSPKIDGTDVGIARMATL